ncbi:MAG: prepilin-type N-terminal cleavage/methylation domain-containing protein [Nitrospirota bacterium]|nr:prepilin-type N-terminal cleavage/methylation domain-containing protein [Nitrospirota bacterium]
MASIFKTDRVRKAAPRYARFDRGFTLIEVLIAVAISAGMLVLLYAAFFSVMRGRQAVDEALERTREVSRFLDVFSSEVHSSFYLEKNRASSFVGDASAGASRIAFTFFSYPRVSSYGASSDVVAVRYSVDVAADGVRTLYREAWNPYATDGVVPMKVEVIEGIEGFEASYYNGSDWTKAWNASLENKLPQAVRVVLSIKEKGVVMHYPITARTMIR